MNDNKYAVVKNVDNKMLEPREVNYLIGHVESVNGDGARECPEFIPTAEELRRAALYWMSVCLDNELIFFTYGQTGSSEYRENQFALRRIARIKDVIGEEEVQRLWDEAYASRTEKLQPDVANAFRFGGTSDSVENWRTSLLRTAGEDK